MEDIEPFRYRGYYYDEETGFYATGTRYYDPEIGRFINADGYVSTGQGIIGYNMYVYCGNDPINRVDPFGKYWCKSTDYSEQICEKVEEYLTPSNIYGSTVGGASIAITALAASLESAIKTSVRPNNIGIGTYAQQCAKDLQYVSKFSNGASKFFKFAPYGAVAIDVGIGIYDNINNGASTKKIVLDASVDVVVTGGSIWAAGMLGSAIGTSVGTVIPGAGNLVGGAAGFVIGIGIYVVTDMILIDGKNIRTWIKEGVNNIW